MQRAMFLSLTSLLHFGVVGCEGSTETTSSTDVGTSGGDSASTASTTNDAETLAFGEPCELAGVGPEIMLTAITREPACEGEICLLAHDALVPCESDAECAMQSAYGTCSQEGLCNLAPGYVEEHARCTRTCRDESDCPDIPGCSDVACGVMTAFPGEFCCERVCYCTDAHAISPTSNDMLCDGGSVSCR